MTTALTPATVLHVPLRDRIHRARATRRLSCLWRRCTERTVTVTIDVDTAPLIEGLRALADAGERARVGINEQRRRRQFQRELQLVRAEARWYIRGANRHWFINPDDALEDCDAQVQAMLREQYPPRLVLAYIRGVVESLPAGDRPSYYLQPVLRDGLHIEVTS